MTKKEYITVDYQTISALQKRELMELCSSSLINGFNFDDYMAVLAVFRGVVDRLEGVRCEWIESEDGYYICSACGIEWMLDDGAPEIIYCPNCGAKLEETR